jgi:hypothetical protein
MAEIINLKRARKDKARRERDAEAQANRTRFGRTRAEKAADKDGARREQSSLEGKKLGTPEDQP